MRRSTVYLTAILMCGGMFASLLIIHPRSDTAQRELSARRQLELVEKLGLTDLCLFTEARYTRHLSQADLASALQDHPMSFEHFPSGSLTLPPVLR